MAVLLQLTSSPPSGPFVASGHTGWLVCTAAGLCCPGSLIVLRFVQFLSARVAARSKSCIRCFGSSSAALLEGIPCASPQNTHACIGWFAVIGSVRGATVVGLVLLWVGLDLVSRRAARAGVFDVLFVVLQFVQH